MNVTQYGKRLSKKPTAYRYFLALALTLALGPFLASPAGAQESARADLTDSDAVRMAIQRPSLIEALEGDVAVEEGHARTARAYPKPQLSYMREQTFGPLGTGEDYLSLAQTLDLGNRRGLHGQAGEKRADSARREGDAERLEISAEVRLRFYEVLRRQQRIEAIEGWLTKIDDALGVVTRREERGDAARYDRLRLERERLSVAAQLEAEQAALGRAQGRLLAMLGTDIAAPDLRVVGTLLPNADPDPLPSLRASSQSHPSLVALDSHADAAALDRTAASRAWVPDLRIEGGWKGVDMGMQGRTDGFLLGASLLLPLWDQSRGAARTAEAEARAARGRRALLESELLGEVRGTHEAALRLRQAAKDFRTQLSASAPGLLRMASAGYEGGELGLLELLDAYRGVAEDSLHALELEHQARISRVELDRLTGAQLP